MAVRSQRRWLAGDVISASVLRRPVLNSWERAGQDRRSEEHVAGNAAGRVLPSGATGNWISRTIKKKKKKAERNGSAAPRIPTERPAACQMDGGSSDEGKQERHLVLAHKLFLLSQPDVDYLSKVALRAEVLDAVKSDDMAPLFESLTAVGLLEPDAALLAEMRGRIDEETRKLDEKIVDAEENLVKVKCVKLILPNPCTL